MPAAATPSKANYKTFESQARLIRAMVAAHPEVKWNYKEIVECYGSDMSEHALNHRFRVIKAHVEIVRIGRAQGLDMARLPAEPKDNPRAIDKVDKSNIAKYFGTSTGDGVQFQFRGIKKDASAIKSTVDAGGDPRKIVISTGAGEGPASTPRSGARAARKTPASRSRKKSALANDGVQDDTGDDDDVAEIDTPTKPRDKIISGRVAKTTSTPASSRVPRTAALKAADTIAQQTRPPSPPVDADLQEEQDQFDKMITPKAEPEDDDDAFAGSFESTVPASGGAAAMSFQSSTMSFPAPGMSFSDSHNNDDLVRSSASLFGGGGNYHSTVPSLGMYAGSGLTPRMNAGMSLHQLATTNAPGTTAPSYAPVHQNPRAGDANELERLVQDQQDFLRRCYGGQRAHDYADGEF